MIKITNHGHYVLQDDSHISRWVEQSGRLDCDGQLLPQILKRIQPGWTVWDVGAFIGDHTLAYLDKVGPMGHVVAFEPNPEAFACLMMNCNGYWNLTALPYGLGLSTTLLPFIGNANAGACRIGKRDEAGSRDLITVVGDRIRLPKPDLIKLDCEGFEHDILVGLAQTIKTYKPIIVMECHRGTVNTDGACSWLGSMRYSYRLADPNSMSWDHEQYDIIAECH